MVTELASSRSDRKRLHGASLIGSVPNSRGPNGKAQDEDEMSSERVKKTGQEEPGARWVHSKTKQKGSIEKYRGGKGENREPPRGAPGVRNPSAVVARIGRGTK